MLEKNTLVICKSVHHNNTYKVAAVLAAELHAVFLSPEQVGLSTVSSYKLIGFGSGIYNQKHHKSLFALVEKMPQQKNTKAFVFSTASIIFRPMHLPLIKALQNKGFKVVDEFICRGFMDYSFVKYFFGGINKNCPNEKDLKNARLFAASLNK